MTDFSRIIFGFFSYIKKIWKLSLELSKTTSCSTMYYFIDCIYCYIVYGCYVEWYFNHFYRLSRPIRRNTLTHNKFKKIYNKYNQHNEVSIFENKVLFNKVFKDFQHHESLYIKESTEKQFIEFVSKHNPFIIKPIDEMQGKGIRKYLVSETDDLESLFALLKKENILIEEIVQSNSSLVFNNDALNTIRVYTILNSKGYVNILGAFLRAGVGNSIVDNFSAGGVLYNIDIKTGIIISKGFNFEGEYLYHPGSSIQMVGYRIPYWDEVKDYVNNLGKVCPQCRIVGWDIAITENGIDIIEGNSDPGHRLLEIFENKGVYRRIIEMLK